MPQYQFMIGTSVVTMVNVESLPTPVNPPKADYKPWTRVVDMATGRPRADGFPQAVWHFDVLTQAMVNQLAAFCPGKSEEVYITTPDNYGVFLTWKAVMVWPDDQMIKRRFGGTFLDLDFIFRRLETP